MISHIQLPRQKKDLSAQHMDKLFSSSFSSSSSLVARNTVSLSVRRHSTAAALAQSATPETQENR